MIAHVYKPRRKNEAGKSVPARLYRGRYRLDGDYALTEVALGTGDKQVAEKQLAEIVAEKERERVGIIAPKAQRLAAQKPMLKHIDDYIDDLESLGRSQKHYSLVKYRACRLIEQIGWRLMKDIDADGFAYWRKRQVDMAPKTQNEYLNAMLGLLNWMERQGRIPANPLRHVEKSDLRGRQKRRRAFSPDEFRRLLAASGDNRIIYLTAAYTGLRLGELKQLVWVDLHLEGKAPFLRARAATVKNRKEAVIPLHPRLAEKLSSSRDEKADDGAPVFRMTAHPERPLYRDMEKAGIERLDAIGRKLDFHSLRYTFATSLAVNGVPQRVAQELMRHSDPKLTANIYTDASQLPTVGAVQGLPWIENEEAPQIAPQKSDIEGHKLSRGGTKESLSSALQPADKKADRHLSAPPVTASRMVEVAGVEPASL